MACNLTGLFKKCFYTGWVGDNDKAYKAKNYEDIFEEEKENCLDSGVSSDEEICQDFTEAELFPVPVVVEAGNTSLVEPANTSFDNSEVCQTQPRNSSPAILHLNQHNNTNKVEITQVNNNKLMSEESNNKVMREESNNKLMREESNNKVMREESNNKVMREESNNKLMREESKSVSNLEEELVKLLNSEEKEEGGFQDV